MWEDNSVREVPAAADGAARGITIKTAGYRFNL